MKCHKCGKESIFEKGVCANCGAKKESAILMGAVIIIGLIAITISIFILIGIYNLVVSKSSPELSANTIVSANTDANASVNGNLNASGENSSANVGDANSGADLSDNNNTSSNTNMNASLGANSGDSSSASSGANSNASSNTNTNASLGANSGANSGGNSGGSLGGSSGANSDTNNVNGISNANNTGVKSISNESGSGVSRSNIIRMTDAAVREGVCAIPETSAAPQQEHAFVGILEDFLANKDTAAKTAFIADLDNDGDDEMITLSVSSISSSLTFWGAIIRMSYNYSVSIYDFEEGKVIATIDKINGLEFEDDNSKTGSSLYLTENNYIVESRLLNNWEETVFEYDKGDVNAREFVLVDRNNVSRYLMNGNQINESEYNTWNEKFKLGPRYLGYRSLVQKTEGNVAFRFNDAEEIMNMTMPIQPQNTKISYIENSVDIPTINWQGVNYYPHEQLLNFLGADSAWIESSQLLYSLLDDNCIGFFSGADRYYDGNSWRLMDQGVRAFLLNDQLYIPGRYAAESLGFELSWDERTNSLTFARKHIP